MTELRQFREQFPQYDDLKDSDLVEALYMKNSQVRESKQMPSLERADFDRSIGYNAFEDQTDSGFNRFSDSMINKATAGFSDEASGAAAAATQAVSNAGNPDAGVLEVERGPYGVPAGLSIDPTVKKAYTERRDAVRERVEDFDNSLGTLPWLIMEITGGLAQGGPAGGIAGGAADLIKQGVKSGAQWGGINAAGHSEGENVEDVAVDTALGTGTGALAGLVGSGVTAGARRLLQSKQPNKEAIRHVAEAAASDNKTPEGLARSLERGRLVDDVPETVMDVSGPNMRDLGAASGQSPGPAKARLESFLRRRGKEAFARIQDIAKGAFGDGDDFLATQDNIIINRSNLAGPYYDAARASGAVVDTAPVLNTIEDNIAKTKGGSKAVWKKVKGLLYNGTPGSSSDPLVLDTSIEGLHAAKMEIDNMIETARENGIGKTLKRALVRMQKELLEQMDLVSEDYEMGRRIFASESSALNALELGRDFMKGDAEVTAHAVNQMSGVEHDMFKIGVAREIKKIAGAGSDLDGAADIARRVIGSPNKRAALLAAFDGDQKEYNRFVKSMERESRLQKTDTAVRHGSRTNANQAATGNLTRSALGMAEAAGRHDPIGVARNAGRMIMNQGKKTFDPLVSSHLSEILTTTDPAALRQILGQAGTSHAFKTGMDSLGQAAAQVGGTQAGKGVSGTENLIRAMLLGG